MSVGQVRADILHKAEQCVCGQREQDYGSPEDNFTRIAKLWSSYMDIPFTAKDVSVMMVLLKVARVKNGDTVDSYVDMAGYAACAGEIAGCEVCRKKEQPQPSLAEKR